MSEFVITEVDVGKELDLCDCFKRSKILDKLLGDAVKNAEAKQLKPLLLCNRKRKPTVAWKRLEDFEGGVAGDDSRLSWMGGEFLLMTENAKKGADFQIV